MSDQNSNYNNEDDDEIFNPFLYDDYEEECTDLQLIPDEAWELSKIAEQGGFFKEVFENTFSSYLHGDLADAVSAYKDKPWYYQLIRKVNNDLMIQKNMLDEYPYPGPERILMNYQFKLWYLEMDIKYAVDILSGSNRFKLSETSEDHGRLTSLDRRLLYLTSDDVESFLSSCGFEDEFGEAGRQRVAAYLDALRYTRGLGKENTQASRNDEGEH
ncbi:MAG: hypothetical protein J6Z43_10315 [Clostridiales bacterium]|nr:hypothetical protein [Clostridiales bacterium]